ncbi:MAG: alpha-mannosidase [Bacteroidetes bacterium B1(2017)]|nr:MAG: alpha-mannosidase [Bacteroidetes bacterium B1(2017)]
MNENLLNKLYCFRTKLLTTLFFLYLSTLSLNSFSQINYAKLVDPFIGTGGHGHTFPGPVVPFGMVQLGPDTRINGSWDGCSGYHYSDSVIYGFSHTHLSGTGCSDYGDIMLMPVAGKATFDKSVYSSKFLHNKEQAKAGYYKVHLEDDNIEVELTSTTRVGFHKYTFQKSGTYQFILDLTHRDKLLKGKITSSSPHSIEGSRSSYAWARDQRISYKIEFSKNSSAIVINPGENGNQTGAAIEFKVKKGESILVKVAISQVDEKGAELNMQKELPNWDFEATKLAAETEWNKELSKIEVSGGTKDQDIIFYTALYHCFIHPSIANDVDGRYLGRDFKIYKADGFNYYTVFSLWDTFRALHPLFNIVQRERNVDFIKTFLEQYKQIGRMPMWELSSNETDCMIGYHSVSIIADAMAKGNDKFDHKLALEACEGTAAYPHFGAPTYAKKGYLSVEDESESVSKSLEYAYDQWCIRKVRENQVDDNNEIAGVLHASLFEQYNWQNVFNAKTGFMQPRMNGGWYEPFNPKEVNNNYTEANAWQYTFFVPQDIQGLINVMGGSKAFEKKLDELFETGSETSGRVQADISGLIGQYAHGNEPSHHMAYLYNYVGKPEKTQARVQQILNEMYHNAPDGLAGNEDCGQMSAWFVFSAMGFYPVTPGLENYQLGSPLFNKVQINFIDHSVILDYGRTTSNQIYLLDSGNKINDRDGYSINHFRLFAENGQHGMPNFRQGKYFVSHDFKASDKPFAVKDFKFKYDSTGGGFLPSPIIEAKSKTFKDSLLITLYENFVNQETRNPGKIYYRIIGSDTEKKNEPRLYKKPFYIYKSCTIEAYDAIDMGENMMGLEASGKFYKQENNWDITLKYTYNKQYTAGGAEGLIDGINGDIDWRKGGWQGYQASNFEATLDLKKECSLNTFYGHFLQDQGAWIMMPKEVEFYVSLDGINYTSVGIAKHDVANNIEGAVIKTITYTSATKVNARYVKVIARNYGKLPSWHLSAGEDAFIFVDEIGVK